MNGRNDHIHGDEIPEGYYLVKLDVFDVINCIEKGTSTAELTSHHEWIKRICAGDEITIIMQEIIKNRHNPAFAEIMNNVEAAIEGHLE
jgi:hypothetical protein